MISIKDLPLKSSCGNLKNSINKSFSLLHVLLICCILIGSPPTAHAEQQPIAKGALFPNVSFTDVLTKDLRSYLGIPQKNKYSLKDMNGTLFIFEVFSTYCLSCPKNIPFLNTVYANSGKDPILKRKVKVMGIAVGNTEAEIRQYNREFKVSYPVLTDYSFAVHKALGNVRVPFTIFVKKDARGRCVVAATHQGVYNSEEEVMKTMQAVLR
jgi:hypothetical protein